MIVTENKTIDETMYRYTYSDAGMKIMQQLTGTIYDDAYDPADSGRTYTETNIPIEEPDEYIEELIQEVKADD